MNREMLMLVDAISREKSVELEIVFQAVEAFRLITGLTPDAERMLRHFAELGRAA